ncbi:MAG: HEAT repeat domain-containing protein [Gemmatimonadaceae bacterium]
MRYSHIALIALASLPLSASTSPLSAQSLAERVDAAPAGRVQFTYAARPGVCGNGRSYYMAGANSWYGSFNDTDRREACVAGPVRVVLDRADREIVSIATYAGPVPQPIAGVTDLGLVRASDAATYLLGLAERSQGRVSRDAIGPAMLADSVDATPRLLAIARNQNAARATRSSAISWLGRSFDERPRAVRDMVPVLVTIASNDDDNQSVREQALRTLARLEHGAGTAALLELARDAQRGWLAQQAITSLTTSGDPRARAHLRDVVRAAALQDMALAAAIRGLGGEHASGEDIKLLRDTYGKFDGDKSRENAVAAIATFGGAENVRWLLALARNPDQPTATRRRAIQHAYRGGTPIPEIIKIYDETTDTQVKEAVMAVLVESGEKAAVDKLMQIARSDDSAARRRRAISLLGRSSDERVREFLASIATR